MKKEKIYVVPFLRKTKKNEKELRKVIKEFLRILNEKVNKKSSFKVNKTIGF